MPHTGQASGLKAGCSHKCTRPQARQHCITECRVLPRTMYRTAGTSGSCTLLLYASGTLQTWQGKSPQAVLTCTQPCSRMPEGCDALCCCTAPSKPKTFGPLWTKYTDCILTAGNTHKLPGCAGYHTAVACACNAADEAERQRCSCQGTDPWPPGPNPTSKGTHPLLAGHTDTAPQEIQGSKVASKARPP